MKKIFCVLALSSLLLFGGCDAAEMSSLREISRPYACEYKCTKLLFGGEDVLGKLSFLKLALDGSGKFSLDYADTFGKKGGYSGEYEMKGERVVFTAKAGGKMRNFEFSYEDGAIVMRLPLGGRLIYAEFRAL